LDTDKIRNGIKTEIKVKNLRKILCKNKERNDTYMYEDSRINKLISKYKSHEKRELGDKERCRVQLKTYQAS
jgi:hypothetical protein